MKTILLLVTLAFSMAAPHAGAAVFKCFKDPAACPTGEHIHCVGHGWCGPESGCNYCKTTPAPATEDGVAGQPGTTETEVGALPDQPFSCGACHNQPRPEGRCRTECGCTSAFCGSW